MAKKKFDIGKAGLRRLRLLKAAFDKAKGRILTPKAMQKAAQEQCAPSKVKWMAVSQLGFKIDPIKDGRRVTGYKMLSAPKLPVDTSARKATKKSARKATTKAPAETQAAA